MKKLVKLCSVVYNHQKNKYLSYKLYNINAILTMKIILLSLVILLSQVHCEDDGDWVDPFQLPIGFLTHPYYAGYLNISSTQAYYYNYFPSEGNPLKDPLIIRISAGPGCSGLYSAYYSKGPFIFVRGSKNFRVNPFNWNKNANLLII